MFATALTAVLSVFQMPADVPLPTELEQRAIATVLQATETHFVAYNTSEQSQVLLFGHSDHGLFASVRVRPGQQVVFPFAQGSSDDVWVEVLGPWSGRLWNTGALSVPALRASAEQTLWIQSGNDRAVAWWRVDRALVHVHPGKTLLPAPARRAPGTRELHGTTAPTHVPVISPNDDQKTKRPPKIDERPLPPV